MNSIEDYRKSHQHPLNRLTHLFGIPMICVSLVYSFFNLRIAAVLFITGWCIQFTGHAIEGNRPAFFKNPIHLISGPIWWIKKIFGV